ncbi:MAG: shikimate kinase [Actinomycetota bacterium]
MNVYLVGMPGSGKSSVGRAIGKRLSVPFVDLDEEVETAAGMSVAEVFEQEGEARFRELEREALSRISARNRAVVACGGGIVLDADNRTLLRASGKVVWLDAPTEILRERIVLGADRPLLREAGDLDRLRLERDPYYREIADAMVDASGDPLSVAQKVVEVLR